MMKSTKKERSSLHPTRSLVDILSDPSPIGFYQDGPGLNDQPLQFNGDHLPRNLDPLFPNHAGFGSHGGVGSMSGVRNGPVRGLQGYEMNLMQQDSFRGNGYILYPDDTGRPLPAPRERPLGCRTILLEGVPHGFTDDMAREMCERIAGQVECMERGNGPFFQIRFVNQEAAGRSFAIHGMHICINNSKAPQFNSRLLIDYVANPQDQFEYEQEQRRIIMERHRQDTPMRKLTLTEFSNPAMERITECIKEDNILGEAIQVIISWLEKGQCNKKTSNQFYRLISLTNSHVRRLQNEKAQSDKEFEQAKQQYINCKRGIVMQLTLLEQVHTSAAKKKVWDHFTKAQRKNLDQWRQMVKDLKAKEEKELRPEEAGEADMDIASEDEEVMTDKGKGQQKSSPQNIVLPETTEVIDLSDEEEERNDENEEGSEETEKEGEAGMEPPPEKKVKTEPEPKVDEEVLLAAKRLKEIEDLKSENEEMKNQVEALKREESSMKEKETQIKALQLAFVNMQQQLKEAKAKLKNEEESRKARETEASSNTSSAAEVQEKGSESVPSMSSSSSRGFSDSLSDSTKSDGTLLSFISIFLHAHPFGASIEYLWSYLSRLQPQITQSEIEKVLRKYPNCFIQELTGVGASLERRWKFVAFDNALKKS